MNYRLMGLAPLLAVAVAATAHAQTANSQGQMAYPEPAKTGQITTPTGTSAPSANPQGQMAYPSPTAAGEVTTHTGVAKTTPPVAKSAPKVAATAPSVAPTKQGMAAARELATKPSDTPVPYVDFAPGPSAKPAGKTATMAHHAKKPTA